MTLPLRKRKHYMNKLDDGQADPKKTVKGKDPAEDGSSTTSEVVSVSADDGAGSKVMRLSSVIQFAKAS